MRRRILFTILLSACLALVAGPVYAQSQGGAGDDRRGSDGRMMRGPANPQDDSGYSDDGYGPPEGDWRCPWCGGYGRGRMRRGHGRGMGPGMMHRGPDRGWGGDPGMRGPGYGRDTRRFGGQPEPLNKDQARLLVENYLRNRRNPNLKVGDVADKEEVFEATIVTQDGALVDKLKVDKETGWFRSVYDR
jgi:hypothetical protein